MSDQPTTKPVAYAPDPVEGAPSEPSARGPEPTTPATPAPGGTKPVPYTPLDADPSPQGYAPGASKPVVVVEGPKRAYRPGDAAGEHGWMKRGERSAWPSVIIAFVLEMGAFGAGVGWIAIALLNAPLVAGAGLGALFGLLFALLVFRDRWRCIEAFASRFGWPLQWLLALGYANARGLKKLVRR